MLYRAAVYIWWILAILYPAVLIFSIFSWFDGPRIGMDAAKGDDGAMVISHVRPGGFAWMDGMRKGDILLEIDDIPITEDVWVEQKDSGNTFSFFSRSGNQVINGRVTDPDRPLNAFATSFLTISVIYALSGFFVFLRTSLTRETATLSLLLLVAGISFGVAPAGWWGADLALQLQTYTSIWTAALFFIFFLQFNSYAGFSALPGRLFISIAVVGTLLLNLIIYLNVTRLPDMFEVTRQITLIQVAGGLLGGLLFLALGYFGTASEVAREQIRVMAFGIAGAVVPFVVLTVVPQILRGSPILPPEVTVLTSVLIPLSFAYAIARHQFMGIRRLVHRGAAYALVSLVIVLVYLSLIGILQAVSGRELSENAAIQVMLLAILFSAMPFISGVRRVAFYVIDRVLYREFVDYRELTRNMSVVAAQAQRVEELSANVLGAIASELRLSFAAFASVVDGSPSVLASAGNTPANLTAILDDEFDIPGRHPVRESDADWSDIGGKAVIVELSRQEEDRWVLCLGPKTNEEPFLREDIDLAQSVAGQIATIVEKLSLLDELQIKNVELRELNRRLVDTQEVERARIASYLHDEPLQGLSDLMWQYAELSTGVQNSIQSISDDLRNFASRLHPGVLEDLGLVRALEWLGSTASEESGFRVHISLDGVERGDRLDPAIELAIYRISQEALSNCERHARADNVWLALEVMEGSVRLAIEDDGVGISATDGHSPRMRLGLVGMRERAEQLGGRLRIQSRSPSGTQVVAEMPIDARATASDSAEAEADDDQGARSRRPSDVQVRGYRSY